jgi:hypothetical protein
MISSVSPSTKYSPSGSALRFFKGNTAMIGRSAGLTFTAPTGFNPATLASSALSVLEDPT